MVKIYLKSYAYLFGLILLFTIILSIINYFVVFPTKVIKILIPIISMLVATIILGKNTKSRAYLEGIKFASFYMILSIIISLITKNPFNFKLILSYLLILFTGVIGSMIGINFKKKL